jgi:hypothetical protein
LWDAAASIVAGRKPVPLVPNFTEAVEVYLATNTDRKTRDPVGDKKFRKQVNNVTGRFKNFLGEDRLSVTRAEARGFLHRLLSENLSESSIGR